MTTHKNPYIKTNQAPSYEVPAYTPDNFFAQMDWNKEIENNKQGYLAVDQMTMKEFYDAGGYAFINDYYGELADIDAAYDRAKPSYGVKGEQMAQAGLTGSGYSDYLGGKAYAGRVAGQAMARQNAMAQSNAFRSAYNQYLSTVRTKRDENLQTVIDRAISVNMNPDNFTDVATKLGIPQADAERGKEQLIAYYQGLNGTGTGTSAGSTTGSAGSVSGTTADAGAFWGKNEYGVTPNQMKEAKTIQTAIEGGLTGYTKNGNVIVPQAPTLEAQVAALYGGQYTVDSPVVQAGIKLAVDAQTQNIVGLAQRGQYTDAKAMLDEWAAYGLFGKDGKDSEQYKATLAKVQESTAKEISKVTTGGTMRDMENFFAYLGDVELKKLGIDPEEITEENIASVYDAVRKTLHDNKLLSDTDYQKALLEDYGKDIELINNEVDLKAVLTILYSEKEELGAAYEELLKRFRATTGIDGIKRITLEKGGGWSSTPGMLLAVTTISAQPKTKELKGLYKDMMDLQNRKNTAN